MKLLMISGDRSVLQGKQSAFWYTLQELRKHWDRIDIICPRVRHLDVALNGIRHEGEKEEKGGDVFFHPCPYRICRQIKWIKRKGTSLIVEQNHDVMTVHDYPPFYNGIGARKVARKTGIPYALEVHHIVGWPIAASFVERIGRFLSWLYFARASKKASAVRVVNESVKKKLVSWGVSSRNIDVVPSFYLDKNILSKDFQPPVSYDVSFCARLVPNKGLKDLLYAIAKLPTARLLVIGTGPQREHYERLARSLNLGERVTFLGWLPTQEAVMGAIQTARIFVMNSKSEGGPRVALEAMACGMPLIATKVGAMPEVIEDGKNGIFTTGDPDDLAKKISMLLSDEEKRETIGKEAAKILKKFERSVLVKNYADFLKTLT